MTDIKKDSGPYWGNSNLPQDKDERRDQRIALLEAQLAKAREALQPFANAERDCDDEDECNIYEAVAAMEITFKDLRRAAKVHKELLAVCAKNAQTEFSSNSPA